MIELSLRALAAYSLLAIPSLCLIPSARVIVGNARRYDLGILWPLVASALLCAFPFDSRARLGALVAVGVVMALAMIRTLVLARGTTVQYTMMALGAFWALPTVVDQSLKARGAESGVNGFGAQHSLVLLSAAIMFCLAMAFLIERRHLDLRLQAMTDSPDTFAILLESRTRVALEYEMTTLICGFVGGGLVWLVANNIEATQFRFEAIWVLISASLAARFRWYAVPLAPLMISIVRLALKQSLPASLTEIITYATLAILVFCLLGFKQRTMVARG